MITAILGVCNDVEIAPVTVSHMLDHVDRVIVSDGGSDDGTYEALLGLNINTDRLTLAVNDAKPFNQADVMNDLAYLAAKDGATWIVPFDADEFIVPVGHRTVKEAVESVSSDVGILSIRPWWHLDWYRKVTLERYDKIAFKWHPGAKMIPGQHSVSGVPGITKHEVLHLREIQYQSFEHFCRKVRFNLRPGGCVTVGDHYRALDGFDDEQMSKAWVEYQSMPCVFDPIPSLYRP